jgi:hypothetical protein
VTVAKHPNYRRIKKHRTYTVEELAQVTGVHENTVRAWHKAGLQPVDDSRPILFRGSVAVDFLRQRRATVRRPCGPGEMFCLPCREVQRPAGDMVEYVSITPTSGNMRGICPDCHRLMHRRTSKERLQVAAGDLEVTITDGDWTLEDPCKPSVNSDFEDDEESR